MFVIISVGNGMKMSIIKGVYYMWMILKILLKFFKFGVIERIVKDKWVIWWLIY